MVKAVLFGAVAAASVLASGTASAQIADTIRVSIAGKTADQVNADIDTAARAVCGQADAACVQHAVYGARRQLVDLIHLSDRPDAIRVTILDGTVYAVRVSLHGQSSEQLNAAIASAAVAVCRHSEADGGCVATALEKTRQELASNQ